MSVDLTGAVVGAAIGLSLLLVIRRLPFLRQPSVDERVAPYLRDLGGPSAFGATGPPNSTFHAVVRIFEPSLRGGARRLERVLGGAASVRRRLARAGSDHTVEDFRIEQLIWGAIGFGIAFVASVFVLAAGRGNAIGMILLCGASAVFGVLARDTYLSSQVKQRERRLIDQLPTVAELLALSVAAGEGPAAALERVTRSCRGELVDELNEVLASTRTGESLVRALDSLAARTGLLALSRFADGIAVALERGTPLADVLRAQAGDIREGSKRELIESGAKREVAMMIPVVFLVLPVTIAFAFFPGAIGIRLIAG